MKLVMGALATIAVGWAVVLLAPKPLPRQHPWRAEARRAKAEQTCRAQGPSCRLVSSADAPRDTLCICD